MCGMRGRSVLSSYIACGRVLMVLPPSPTSAQYPRDTIQLAIQHALPITLAAGLFVCIRFPETR